MREESSRAYDVFLSHSSKDKTWADAACAVLGAIAFVAGSHPGTSPPATIGMPRS